MEPTFSIAAVVFDIGGVLATPSALAAHLAGSIGADPVVFDRAYWEHRDGFDRGAPASEYWAKVGADCGVAELTGAQVGWLDREDARRWATLAPDRTELLGAVAAAGVRLALLSNAPHALARVVRASAWADLIGVQVFSAELGIAKPDPAVYRAVEDRLGLAGDRVAFFDDRRDNVAAAGARGWAAFVWAGPAECRMTLRELGVPVG